MKSFSALVILALVAGCLAEATHEDAEKCMKEVGANDKEDLENDEAKRKCFMKCVLESARVVDADGTPNYENAEQAVAEKISDEGKRKEVMDAFKECADKSKSQEADACGKGAILFECMMENKDVQEIMKS